ncbi:class I SAM-dependent methyltransferase [Ferrovibrio terrae]|uniref:Class I SAM-dependent methyltransferase n=1 Tax=Ferrovibrio terrae TaxID=2594003 RepID=A0A516GXY9_9PROT|nr:class I SAM-dependent methyltransferase [Ferrovibrio terrae]QDO96355.1 class I SAM-dependent methyltransferase [Ferrovibrio terrae]
MFIASFSLKTFVQRLLCEIQEIVDFAHLHPVREMQKLALAETVKYIKDNMSDALGCYTAKGVLDVALKKAARNGHYLEFGVFRGGTIRYIAKHQPQDGVNGFDSFEGLPESWSGYTMDKGTFNLDGRLPKVPANVRLHPGWFDKSLPAWLDRNEGPVSFVHVDCDLYSSTKTIFDLLRSRLQAGSVIVFDEYFGYPNWQKHEFRAFQEFVTAHDVTYSYLAYSRIQVAVQITAIGRSAAA